MRTYSGTKEEVLRPNSGRWVAINRRDRKEQKAVGHNEIRAQIQGNGEGRPPQPGRRETDHKRKGVDKNTQRTVRIAARKERRHVGME